MGKISTEAEAHRVVEFLLMNGPSVNPRRCMRWRSLKHRTVIYYLNPPAHISTATPGKIARATHNMWAFRVWDERKNAQVNGA